MHAKAVLTCALALSLCAAAFAQLQITGHGAITGHGLVTVGSPASPLFHTLMTGPAATFAPGSGGLATIPCLSSPAGAYTGFAPCGGNLPAVGYQGGDFVSGYVFFDPWVVARTLSTACSGGGPATCPIPNSVLTWYNSGGSGGFSTAANWGALDLQEAFYGLPNCPNTYTGSTLSTNYCPTSYNSGIVVGANYYLVPAEIAPKPVFAMVNTMGTPFNGTSCSPPSTCTAFSFLNGSSISGLGTNPGWATGIYDPVNNSPAKYIYFAPTVLSRTIVRHDTAQDTGGVLSSSGWATFNYYTNCGYDTSFLGSVYDGKQYVYFIPGTGNPAKSLILRLDLTQGASSFATCTPYTPFDMANIGTGSIYPSWVGNGAVSNLKGMGGAVIAPDSSGNVWLYIMPWNTVKNTYTNLTLGTTATRVQIGAWSGGSPGSGTFSASDFTSPSAQWEIFDMQTLSSNPQFGAGGSGWNSSPGATFGPGDLAGQSTLGGYQGGWYNSATATPMVIFSASISQFEVEHNPNHLLNDPTGWYLGTIDIGVMKANEYIGGFVQGISAGGSFIYPSPALPSNLVQIPGM